MTHNKNISILIICMLAGLAGCGGGGDDPGGVPPPPATPPPVQTPAPTVTLTATPASAQVGDAITLTWSSTHASACTGSGAWAATLDPSGTRNETAGAAGTLTYTLSCTGAGGSGSAAASVTIAAAPAVVALTAEPAGYREVKALALGELDAALATEAGLSVVQIPGASGPAMQYALGEGNILYFLSPAEQFDDSASVLRISNAAADKQWEITFPWVSRQGDSLLALGDSEVDESWTVVPSGVDKSGFVGKELAVPGFSLGFTLQGLPTPPDPSLMKIAMETPTEVIDLTQGFTLDSATGKVNANASGLATIRGALESSPVVALTFSLPSAAYAAVYGFEQTLTHAAGTVQLSIRNADGSAAADVSGVSFVAKGFNTGTTALVMVDANGKAQFSGLPADTYEIRQVLLKAGLPLVGFAYLPASTAEVSLELIKAAPAGAASAGAQVRARSKLSFTPRVAKSADAERAREAQRLEPKSQANPQALSLADYSVTATAQMEGALIATPVNFTVPKGTSRLGVHVEVMSAEYPKYTTSQSQYNDLWLFNVQLPAPLVGSSQTGKVNQTHLSSGTISFDNCVDVSAAATNGALAVGGQVAAQNVGDSSLPTSVTLSLTLGCQVNLQVQEFIGRERSQNGYYILFPRRKASSPALANGNVAGQYFSMPRQERLPEGFGIPATLRYSPAEAAISEVELFQKTPSGEISLGKDYLAQATAAPGKLAFAGLRLNPTVLAPLQERIQITAVLKGTVAGAPAQSAAVPLTIGEHAGFTPIYRASEMPGYNALNRFGQPEDIGGDSWATSAMTDWIFAEGLRYNDISGALVAQHGPSKYRSVLDHSGHSDAQQADLRYWDGAGGFTDPLGGRNKGKDILDLANTALAEVNAGAATKPNLQKLVAWIAQNRSGLTGYSNRPNVRVIYIGKAHISNLLIQGKFPDAGQTAIPGVPLWTLQTGMSPRITAQESHLDHWHVSTHNP